MSIYKTGVRRLIIMASSLLAWAWVSDPLEAAPQQQHNLHRENA
jgi:hypothetical protein